MTAAKHDRPNLHDSRESWLRSAANDLRPYFESQGYPLPESMRFAIAFPSTGRRGRRVGEHWHPEASADRHHEIIIRADLDDPVQVLGVLVHELGHAALPPEAGHGKDYKKMAQKIGLEGQMRQAMPGLLLSERLAELAASLGPLPHARLDLERTRDGRPSADRPKKQRARLLKADCADPACGYTVRVTAKWVRELGPPGCPKHGPMEVALPADGEEGETETDEQAGLPGDEAPSSNRFDFMRRSAG
jgi:hypothetical protein